MNAVTKLFKDIPNDLLKVCFEEILELQETGFLCEGETRKIIRQYDDITAYHAGIDPVLRCIVDEVALRTYQHL